MRGESVLTWILVMHLSLLGFSHNYLRHYVREQLSATLLMSLRKEFLKVDALIPISMIHGVSMMAGFSPRHRHVQTKHSLEAY